MSVVFVTDEEGTQTEESRRPLPEAGLEEDREFCHGGWGHLSRTEDSVDWAPHCPQEVLPPGPGQELLPRQGV